MSRLFKVIGWRKPDRYFITNNFVKIIVMFLAFLIIAGLLSIVGFIIWKSVYFFQQLEHLQHRNFLDFLVGKPWNPTAKPMGNFGIWTIIISSFFVLLLALIFAVPLVIFSSLFINEYLSARIKSKVIGIIQLLAGIPSVVFGLFSLSILGPLFMKMGARSSTNLLVTAITLAFMGMPIMISLTINALEAIPMNQRYNAYALGLTKIQTVYQIVFKRARLKIVGAIMFGITRIIGETMAVLMICGNNSYGPNFHNGFLSFLFSEISTLASTIGLEILESTTAMHTSALFAIGLVLFILVFVINLLVLFFSSASRFAEKYSFGHRHISTAKNEIIYDDQMIKNKIKIALKKKQNWQTFKTITGLSLLISATIIVVSFTGTIILTIIVRGLFSLHFPDLISVTSYKGGAGILATFLVTILLVICSMVFSIPLALIVAIYLNEYARPNNPLIRFLKFFITVLSSIPSILYGLFGLLLFISICKIPLSIFSASLTIVFVVLPMLIKNIQDSLFNVPQEYRNASYSLGVNKAKTIAKVVLPNSMSGISTSVILAMSRVIGESAPIYLTLGSAVALPTAGFLSPGASMATEILNLWRNGINKNVFRIMYELSLCIMVMVLLLNWLANHITNRLSAGYYRIKLKDRFFNCKIFIKNLFYQ